MCGPGAKNVPNTKSDKTEDKKPVVCSNIDIKVLVVFSSVPLTLLKRVGKVTIVDENEVTFSTEKYYNNIEYECYSEEMNFTPNELYYDHRIFVDCSDIPGIAAGYACGLEDEELKVWKTRAKSSLIGELNFALRELKQIIVDLKKENQNITVGLSISAIHPVECLLFAFQKILGCYVPEEEVYKDFIEEANNDSVLANAVSWNIDNNATVKLEYCGVHQIYMEYCKRKTPQSIKKERIAEIKRLMALLEKAAPELQKSYYKWKTEMDKAEGDEMYKVQERYHSVVNRWTEQGLITKAHRDSLSDNERLDQYGHYNVEGFRYTYLEPYAMFEGVEYDKNGLQKLLDEIEHPQIDLNYVQQQRKEIKDKRTKDASEMRERVNEFSRRNTLIEQKINELESRTKSTDKMNSWREKTSPTYETSNAQERDKDKIEFEGNLMNKDQLEQEHEANLAAAKANKDDYEKRDAIVIQQLDELDKLEKDLNAKAKELEKRKKVGDFLSVCQFSLGITLLLVGIATAVCVIAAPIAVPILGVVAGVGTIVGIGLEVTQWAYVDQGKNGLMHGFSIGFDLVTFKFGAVFKRFKGIRGVKAIDEIPAKIIIDKDSKIITEKAKSAFKEIGKKELSENKQVVSNLEKGIEQQSSQAAKTTAKAVEEDSKTIQAWIKIISDAQKEGGSSLIISKVKDINVSDLKVIGDAQRKDIQRAINRVLNSSGKNTKGSASALKRKMESLGTNKGQGKGIQPSKASTPDSNSVQRLNDLKNQGKEFQNSHGKLSDSDALEKINSMIVPGELSKKSKFFAALIGLDENQVKELAKLDSLFKDSAKWESTWAKNVVENTTESAVKEIATDGFSKRKTFIYVVNGGLFVAHNTFDAKCLVQTGFSVFSDD